MKSSRHAKIRSIYAILMSTYAYPVRNAKGEAVTDFVCGAEQSDDQTMLAILYKGPVV